MRAPGEVVRAAVAAGATLVDTADFYGNEREVGEAAGAARIVTKGGLVRTTTPRGWRVDGRASYLTAAARASRERLPRIDLYLLHAPDPGTAIGTSVRALAALREEGVVGGIGVCNATRPQLEAAMAVTTIDALQVELSPWRPHALVDGLVRFALDRGLLVMAHRPFGGPQGIARLVKAGIAPAQVLAWLRSHGVVPLPGPSRVETAREVAAPPIEPAEIAALDLRFLGDRPLAEDRRPKTGDRPQVVVICGIQGSGKSTLAQDYVERGYLRLNRDDRGGTLKGLAAELKANLASGAERVVLDNTYATRSSRAQVLAACRATGATARCIVVDVSIERAQLQAASRMLAQHGRLLEPAEIARDKTALGPSALFRFRRQWEPVGDDEGFASIEHVVPPVRASSGAPGVLVELDGVLWTKRGEIEPARLDALTARISAWRAEGRIVAATTWLPDLDDDTFARLAARIDIPVERCKHPAGPPVCWCRKPLPGMALLLAHRLGLDLSRTLVVGAGPMDRTFAERIGARFELVPERGE